MKAKIRASIAFKKFGTSRDSVIEDRLNYIRQNFGTAGTRPLVDRVVTRADGSAVTN